MATKAENRLTTLKVVSYILVAIWLIIAAFPFLWTVWGSFKVQGDFFSKADWTNAIYGIFTTRETGGPFTLNGYYGAWIEEEFWRNVINTTVIVFFTVVISLTFGTLGDMRLHDQDIAMRFGCLWRRWCSAQCPTSRWFLVTCCPSLNGTFGDLKGHQSSCWLRLTNPSRFGCCIAFS